MKQTEIAAAVNRSQPAIANAMRLLKLPEDVRQRIHAGELSLSHGVALAKWHEWPQLVTALADIAVRDHWTSAALEQVDLDRVPELYRLGVIRPLRYSTPFDASVCKQCPFGAYRKEGVCLKPEHYNELEAAAQAAREAKVAAAVEQAQSAGDNLPRLDSLPYDSYADLSYRTIPPGCTEACECRGKAVNRHGEVVAICTRPRRLQNVEAQQTKVKRKEKRNAAGDALERAIAQVDALEQLDSIAFDRVAEPMRRELAIIVSAALLAVERGDLIEQACEHTGVPVKISGTWSIADHIGELAQLSLVDLIQLGAEAVLRLGSHALADENYHRTSPKKWIQWYLGEEEQGR